MILPLADDDSDRYSAPLVTLILIGVNVVVFVAFQWVGTNETFTLALTTVPHEIVTGESGGNTIRFV